ncbi:hypothetical protein [Enterococcus sp. HY326]|uniref:hypothetical protein n=1 Tax=Enterococcus sp. HY326 TaxID=2971265 RepID=UPI00223FA065|nr:hypothetical protein [Enterococcus sp. HY326]
MTNKEKEIMRALIELMQDSDYQLDETSQNDFNHQTILLFRKMLDMDYMVPFIKF